MFEAEFFLVTQDIFENETAHDLALRKFIAELCRAHLRYMIPSESFRTLVGDCPELGVEMWKIVAKEDRRSWDK